MYQLSEASHVNRQEVRAAEINPLLRPLKLGQRMAVCCISVMFEIHNSASALQSGRSRGIGLGKDEEEQLRTFIVNMVSEPLVLVIKLADRLHNMRTVFALKKDKQKAVATETLQVWCSLAERLGMMVLKACKFAHMLWH